jgi:hypothetical protein
MKTAAIGLLVLVGAMLAPVPGLAPGLALAGKSPPMIKLPRAGFELIGHERGVNVYQNDGSDMIWVAAVGVIPAPIDKVEGALLDFERQVGKIGRLSEAKVLSTDKDGLYVYERLNLPVIDDRDFTARVTHGTEGARHWITYWLANDRGPAARDGIVRVTRQRGAWDLVAMPDGKGTLARYELRIDLGGSIPLWMVKPHSAEELPQLFADVCHLSLPESDQGKCQ